MANYPFQYTPSFRYSRQYQWHVCHGHPFTPIYGVNFNSWQQPLIFTPHRPYTYSPLGYKFYKDQHTPLQAKTYSKPKIAQHGMQHEAQTKVYPPAKDLWIDYAIKWLKDYGFEPSPTRVKAMLDNYAPNLKITEVSLTPQRLASKDRVNKNQLRESAWPEWLKKAEIKIPLPSQTNNTPQKEKPSIDLDELIEISAGEDNITLSIKTFITALNLEESLSKLIDTKNIQELNNAIDNIVLLLKDDPNIHNDFIQPKEYQPLAIIIKTLLSDYYFNDPSKFDILAENLKNYVKNEKHPISSPAAEVNTVTGPLKESVIQPPPEPITDDQRPTQGQANTVIERLPETDLGQRRNTQKSSKTRQQPPKPPQHLIQPETYINKDKPTRQDTIIKDKKTETGGSSGPKRVVRHTQVKESIREDRDAVLRSTPPRKGPSSPSSSD